MTTLSSVLLAGLSGLRASLKPCDGDDSSQQHRQRQHAWLRPHRSVIARAAHPARRRRWRRGHWYPPRRRPLPCHRELHRQGRVALGSSCAPTFWRARTASISAIPSPATRRCSGCSMSFWSSMTEHRVDPASIACAASTLSAQSATTYSEIAPHRRIDPGALIAEADQRISDARLKKRKV